MGYFGKINYIRAAGVSQEKTYLFSKYVKTFEPYFFNTNAPC